MAPSDPEANRALGFRPRRRRAVRALALAAGLSGAIAVADAQIPGRTPTALGLLATVPFVIATFGGTIITFVAGCIAAGTAAMMADYDNKALDQREIIVILAGIAAATACAAAMAALKNRRLQQLDDTRAVAHIVQQTLLRPLPPAIGDIRIAAYYCSATRGALVGGDIFEARTTPFGLRVLIGDVRGKGLPALQLANVTLGAFREWAYEAVTLTDLAAHLDASVARDGGPEEFVTVALVEITKDAVDVLNCGHPAPLLIEGGRVSPITPHQNSLPLGLGATGSVERHRFGPGTRLLLFTDGVSEARRRNRFFDVTAAASRLRQIEAYEFVRRLRRDLMKFTRHKLNDDVAILLLERQALDDEVTADVPLFAQPTAGHDDSQAGVSLWEHVTDAT